MRSRRAPPATKLFNNNNNLFTNEHLFTNDVTLLAGRGTTPQYQVLNIPHTPRFKRTEQRAKHQRALIPQDDRDPDSIPVIVKASIVS